MNVTPHNKITTKKRGRIKRINDIPEDFNATSSKLSPSLPKVIIEESNMAIGIASITMVALAYIMNWVSVKKSRPLPTRSSIYFQRVCIIRTNSAIKNVAMNGHMNAFKTNLSNFFITD
jgi:hypothetical protein